MEIASGLREQFHSHTVSKQERHHCDHCDHCDVVKFVIVVSFSLLLFDLNRNVTNDPNLFNCVK